MEYRNSFENYAYLWVDDRQEFLRQFLLYGHVLTPEEIEAAGEEGVAETPPSLVQYKEQVDTYEQIFTAVEQFEVHIHVQCMRHFACVCVSVLGRGGGKERIYEPTLHSQETYYFRDCRVSCSSCFPVQICYHR